MKKGNSHLSLVTTPAYERLIISVLITMALLVIINELTSKNRTSIDQAKIPDDVGFIEGYVVSKRMSYIWLANEPVSIWRRVTGIVTEGYDKGRIKVFKHSDAEKNVLKGLKLNQKVRVYCDQIKESNPPKTSAYYVEVINHH